MASPTISRSQWKSTRSTRTESAALSLLRLGDGWADLLLSIVAPTAVLASSGGKLDVELEELTGTYTYRSYRDVPELSRASMTYGRATGIATGGAARRDRGRCADLSRTSRHGPVHHGHERSGVGRVADAGAVDRQGPPAPQHRRLPLRVRRVRLPQWETGVDQRLVIGGTVLRANDHGSGSSLARAGFTSSFLAVRRDA
jgi:hypothetical protein